MRSAVAYLGVSTLAFAPFLVGGSQLGCSSQPSAERVLRTGQAIEGGQVDQTDTNVVAILIASGGQLSSLCSGSLIGPNLVLSAHHCVADPPTNVSKCGGKFSATYSADSFMVTTSYNAAYNIWISKNPQMPTADNKTWWAVSQVDVPTTNNICSADQSLLTLSAPVTGVCPLIPAVDALPSDGDAYTAIGFGITSPSGTEAGERYILSSGLSVSCVGSSDCSDTTIGATGEWEGGSNGSDGTCEGDSGGPSLDSSKRIIGTVSRGPSNSCSSTVYESTYDYGGTTNGAWIKQIALQAATAGGYTAAGWVTGGATSDPSNGYSCSSGGSTSSSSSSSSSGTTGTGSSSSGGSSSGCPTGLTCTDGDGMGDYGCFDTSTSTGFPAGAATCSQTKACATGYTCWQTSSSSSKGDCIQDCTPTTSTTSSSGGSTTSSGGTGGSTTTTGSSGGTTTGTGSGTGTGTGTGTSSGNGGASTSGAGGATSSGQASTSSSGVIAFTSATSTGTGSATGTSSGGISGAPGSSSGCSVAPASENEPTSPASVAGIALGAALLLSRRRR